MEITVKILHRNGDGPTRAYASVKLGGCFVIRQVRVMEGRSGLFVSMPSRKVGDKYEDICFPCTKEMYQRLTTAVLDAYETAPDEETIEE